MKSLFNKTFLLSIAMAASIAFTGFSVESMYINSSGNVGIGTNAPTNILHIKDSIVGAGWSGITIDSAKTAGPAIVLKSNATQGCNTWFLQGCGTTAGQGNGAFAIGSSANPYVMIMNTNGNVGIGTTTPRTKLEIAGDLNVQGKIFGRIYSTTPINLFDNKYFLQMQDDGNLVVYRVSDGKPIWSSMGGKTGF